MSGMAWEAVRPVLHRVDPEDAHELVVHLLRDVQEAPGALTLLRALFRVPDVPVTVAGLRFRNPVGLAAGFDKNCELVPAMAALGFGFVEVGTITRHAQKGNPRPRMFRYPAHGAIVNRLGFNNVGVDQAARTLEHTTRPPGIVLGINVGKSAVTPLEDAPAEYAHNMRVMHAWADYFTLNISSPNTRDLRKLHEPARLRELLDAVMPAANGKPLFLKLSPDASDEDLDNAADMAIVHGVGLIATNTTVNRDGMDGLEQGGLSGRPLRARSTAVLKRLAERVAGEVPLIGVGGVDDAESAREKLAAGASLVQVYSGLIYRGPGLAREIVTALARQGVQ